MGFLYACIQQFHYMCLCLQGKLSVFPSIGLCIKVLLKMREWPGIFEMSNVLHTLANWELSVQCFGSIELPSSGNGNGNWLHSMCETLDI